MKRLDLTGQQFDRLVVLEMAPRTQREIGWICRCACGNTHIALTAKLRNGHARSCGCRKREATIARNKAAATHGMSRSNEFSIWHGIKKRCLCPTDRAYPNYGGRGITICKEWAESFEAFFAYVGPRPSLEHSIEREDNNKGYEPGNVRWATPKEQGANRRNSLRVVVDGKEKTTKQLAAEAGVSLSAMTRRIRLGMTGAALLAPARRWSGA